MLVYKQTVHITGKRRRVCNIVNEYIVCIYFDMTGVIPFDCKSYALLDVDAVAERSTPEVLNQPQ